MSAQDPSPIAIGYRPEIDGLRAIAVLSVVLFHAGMPWFQGGYAGVDCFFVISGFLITSILLKERQSGTSSVTRFYERRARRILPALLVVLVASTLTAYVIMLPSDLHVFARSVVSVVLFSANILFWTGHDFQRADNYFARLLDHEPLIHTWSLGVEEQFYLIFPLIMVVGWSLGRRRLSQLLVLLTVLSFAIAEVGSRRHPKGAFYLLPSRSWELTLGALVACDFTRLSQLSSRARQALTWSGLVLILASMSVYDGTARFPGVAALAPTVGTALILACATETTAGRVLAWRPLVVIGLMSYSLYLWHQPVLAFARYVSLTEPSAQVPTLLAIGLAALVTLVSYVTWRYVETPCRDRQRISSRSVLLGSGLVVAGLVAFGLWLGFGEAANRRTGVMPNIAGLDDVPYTTCLFDADSVDPHESGCGLGAGDRRRPAAFLVVGDSHSARLQPAFEGLASASGRTGHLFAEGGCLPFVNLANNEATERCRVMIAAMPGFVRDNHTRHVFLVARWSAYITRPDFGEAFRRTVNTYAALGASVTVIEQVPEQLLLARRIYWHALWTRDPLKLLTALSVSTKAFARQQAEARAAFASFATDPRVRFIDIGEPLCDQQRCPVGTPVTSYWLDEVHLSADGAARVTRSLVQQAVGE